MVSVVIVSAGKGTRMKNNNNISKQHIDIFGKSIIVRTIEKFFYLNSINEIILVINSDEEEYFNNKVLNLFGYSSKIKLVYGGKERFESVYLGLKKVSPESDIVLVHDGVRPFVTKDNIENIIYYSRKYGAATLAVKSKDTIKYVKDKKINGNIDREYSYMIQTPQGFKKDILLDSYNKFKNGEFGEEFFPTDDSSLVNKNGMDVYVVEGDYNNIKITTISDIIVAEAISKMEELNV